MWVIGSPSSHLPFHTGTLIMYTSYPLLPSCLSVVFFFSPLSPIHGVGWSVGWSCWLSLVQVTIPTVCSSSSGSSWVQWTHVFQKTGLFNTVSHLYIFSYSIFHRVLWNLGLRWEIDIGVPCRAGYSTVTYSQHFDQLLVSELTAMYLREKLLWLKLTNECA